MKIKFLGTIAAEGGPRLAEEYRALKSGENTFRIQVEKERW